MTAGMLVLVIGIGLGVVVAASVLGVGARPHAVEAQPTTGDVTVCVNPSTGQVRFGYPG